jgi:hypothetical protein
LVLVVTVILEGGLQDQRIAQEQDRAEMQARDKMQETFGAAEPTAVVSDDKANAAAERKLVDELRKRQEDAVSSYNVAPAQNAPPPAREFAPSPPAALAPPAPSASGVAKTEAERMKPAAPAQEVVVTGDRLRSSAQEAASPVTVITPDDVTTAGSSAPEADSSRTVEEVVMTGSRRRATGRTAGPRGTISTQSFRADRPASDDQADRSDPNAWLEEIRQLRRDGKSADADREWLRFHEAFPNFPVAADDIARKKP